MAARVLEALCLGCGACVQICPQAAITVLAKQARIDSARCDECEECIFACFNGAIII
ncbi:MAG: 4Fe-4S binding protein [Firmicutes bacterium]|nr:4Fe-4S binding protein [Bacillota bacterium]